MRYPTPGDYQEALQVPQVAFVDPELQHAELETTPLGLPRVITGAFAAVFPVRTRTRRWAVKCFLTEVRDQQTRYEAIARHLQEVDVPYTVAFDYQPNGIRVGEQMLPLLKMAWIKGTPLNQFVAAHLDDPAVLAVLADRWRQMLADLEAAEVAHGDLQHGNVLVTQEDDGVSLRLVDYDTMFVPALKGRRSPEVGHRNYQHPDRDERDFGLYLDRFAGLVIYVALLACRERPDLWPRYDTGENLLFRAVDFYDPAASPLMQDLGPIEPLQPLVEALRQACYLEPEAVPPLEAMLVGGASEHTARVQLRRVQRKLAARSERRQTEPRSLFDRVFLPVLMLVLALALGFGAAGWLLPALVVLGLGVLVVVGSVHPYRRLPVVRRRHRLGRELRYFDRVLERLQQDVDRLHQERGAVVDRTDELRTERLAEVRERVLADHLKYHFVGEASSFQGITHKVVVRLKAAGLRTAYQATPERLAGVWGIGDESRARVALWRSALAAEVEGDLPETLSPAEERRFQRRIQRRLEGIETEVERLREKIRVQRIEYDQVRERVAALPDLSYTRYLGYLLRLVSLPAMHPPRAVPAAPLPLPATGHDEAASPVPAPIPGADAPWWETHPHHE